MFRDNNNVTIGTLIGMMVISKMAQQLHLARQNAGGGGTGIHMLSAIIIGAIFGAAIIKKLRKTGYARGIREGK